MKKLFSLLLVVVMLLSLVACGGGDADLNAGKYLGVSGEMMGITMTMEELYPGESYLELQSGGKAVLVLEGDKIDGKWTLEGDKFNLEVEGENCPGTLKDGVIVFDFAGSGILLTFAKEGAKVPENNATNPVENTNTEPSGADVTGVYQGTTCLYSGQTMQMTDIYEVACTLELFADGTAELILDEDVFESTWTQDGETFVLDIIAGKCPGTLVGDTVVIDFMEQNMIMTFVKGATPNTNGGGNVSATIAPGTYVMFGVEIDGEYYDYDMIYGSSVNNTDFIIFYEDGTADFYIEGDLVPSTYDESALTESELNRYPYAVVDGVLELYIDEITTFYYTAGEIPEQPAGGNTVVDGEFPDYIMEAFSGDWHGWCSVYYATGAYEDQVDIEFEMLARYVFDENGECIPWMAIYADPDSNFQNVALTFDESDEFVYVSGQLFGMEIMDTSNMYDFSGSLCLTLNLADDQGTLDIVVCMRHPDDAWDEYDYPCMPQEAIDYYAGMSFEDRVATYELDPNDLPELP